MSIFSEVNMELAQEVSEKQEVDRLALIEKARKIGITEAQLEFLMDYFAKKNHKHHGNVVVKFETL